jgi:hypothetical protein
MACKHICKDHGCCSIVQNQWVFQMAAHTILMLTSGWRFSVLTSIRCCSKRVCQISNGWEYDEGYWTMSSPFFQASHFKWQPTTKWYSSSSSFLQSGHVDDGYFMGSTVCNLLRCNNLSWSSLHHGDLASCKIGSFHQIIHLILGIVSYLLLDKRIGGIGNGIASWFLQ